MGLCYVLNEACQILLKHLKQLCLCRMSHKKLTFNKLEKLKNPIGTTIK